MNIITTEKTPTICLNMIVKNESHIIQNTLEKLCDKIKFDYWVICDTGSTDNTPQIIIDFFKKKSIKGELFYDEWVNFAYNRTLALKRAYKKTQLLLIFDADDEIVGNIQMPTNVLFDEYHLKFGSEGFMYTRVLLINNYKIFEFLSVIHEFIVCKEQPCKTNVINGDYYVVSGRTGSRNLDKDKYLKDALILEKAYKEALEKNDFLFHRYSYYCANSYRDCGRFEDAIKWYKISLNHEKQWEQEKYTACLYIYQCYTSLNQEDTGFFYLVKSLKYDNERVDCLFPLLVYYCRENMFNVAYNYYLIVKDFFENKYLKTDLTNKLFVNIDKFNFFVPYYMIIVSEKVQDFKCAIRMYEIIFTKKHHMFEKSYIKDILYNLQFFFQFVKDDNNFIKLTNDYIDFLHLNNVNIQHFDFLKNNVYIKAGLNIDKYFPKQKSKKFSKNDCLSSKNILIFTGFSDVNWNYSFMLNKALGGSEKAVAYISRCFPKDYNIFISGYVAYETIENVTYIPLNNLTQLIENTAFNTIIVSRYISFYEMFKECSFYQSYIWAHDTELITYGSSLDATQILTKWNNHINGCICLTEWHQKVFIEKYPILTNKINIINNGIDINSFKKFNKPNKIKNKFIYTSRPERGLNLLLNLWQQILAKIPDATLSISSYVNFPSTPEDVLLKNIIDKTDSITYLGNLNVNKLYEEMSSSEYWLYPTHYPETSCITALEMLMSEVICLYYPVAGLPYTIDKYGIQVTPNSEIDTIVSLTDEQKTQLRKNGKVYAKSCSWEIRAKSWTNILFNNNNLTTVQQNVTVQKDDKITLLMPTKKTNKQKTFCVIHSCTLQTTGTNVLDYIIEVINKTGFIDVVDNVFINNIGLPIENKYQNNKYIVTNYSYNTQLFEYPSLNKIKSISENTPDSNILYLHTKGISHTNINEINCIADWTNMMLYFLVEQHSECINKLNEGYDTVGCNYIERNQYTDKKHFSGNYWWSKSTYINKLEVLNENRGHRAYAEFWLFTENPSHYDIYSSNTDHYINLYPMEKYSQNSIIKQLISK